MTRDELIGIFLEKEPSARSPYGLYGYPPMWLVATVGDEALFARPGRTMVRIGHAWTEIDGVHWQARRGETWLDQGCQSTFEDFLAHAAEWQNRLSAPSGLAESAP
ncbi:hypothetical protein LAZ40_07010 [Cereibacter sphaeroides]|uniref:hypothetical protein n=1 Tax=Cereibacter sphaeroides TaxID=1063 RepID=UPI001F341C31|nr:hypothetical protein [Cereibacter sphaeroides]MCE6958797.1 hypothetical protein [Cereibacter sphaeroides]MCE6973329.1 hypothetical protein [Cereibacter sphaeroides]